MSLRRFSTRTQLALQPLLIPMRALFGFTLAALVVTSIAFGEDYNGSISEGTALFQSKDYQKSSAAFEGAFKLDARHANDFYNGARAAALAGKTDLAFDWLQKASDLGWANPQHLQTDADLTSLHDLPRWQPIVTAMKNSRKALDANIDKPLRNQLRAILGEDQKYRVQIEALEKASGDDSPQLRDLWKVIAAKDAENLAQVEVILGERGWLGPDIVGTDGSNALFLVIQHANLKTQEKYLPMMRAPVMAKKAEAQSLALLEDRVALGEGRHQTYGSQIGFNQKTRKYYILPLDDPDGVDQRRAAVGLQPLADYVKAWEISWDPSEYKKHLPEREKLEN
jgi:tetratricopeptide (TPR) repeat protein